MSKNGCVSPARKREMGRSRDECWGAAVERERETRVRCNCVGRCPGRDWVQWGSYEAGFSFWEERGGTKTSGSDWRQTRRVSPVNQSGTIMDTTRREVGCGPCASPYLSVSCVFPSWERVLVFGKTGGSRVESVGSCQSSVTARHGGWGRRGNIVLAARRGGDLRLVAAISPCRKQIVHCASRHPSTASKAQVRCRRAIRVHAMLAISPACWIPSSSRARDRPRRCCRLSRGIIVNLEAAVRAAARQVSGLQTSTVEGC